jgi:hypothetical protein
MRKAKLEAMCKSDLLMETLGKSVPCSYRLLSRIFELRYNLTAV